MSLVNKMLRDLESRAPQAANDTVVPSLVVTAPPDSPVSRRTPIAAMAAVAVLGIGAGIWYWWPAPAITTVETPVLAGPVLPVVAPPDTAAPKTSASKALARPVSSAVAQAAPQEAIAISPQQVDRLEAAVAALRDGDPARAERLFRELLAGQPGNVRARELLAGLYIETGRMTEAVALLDRGLVLSPKHRGMSFLLARLLTEQGEEPRARAILDGALSARPSDADLNTLAAALDTRAGRNQQAAAHYRAAIAARPDDGRLWLGLGIALEAQGERRDARDAFQRARLAGLDVAGGQYADARIAALATAD